MTNPRTRTGRRAALLLAACAWLGHAPAPAQSGDYPNKPIRVVVTFPPGGSTDAVIRLVAPSLGERRGQQVVIDNKPGAGGNVGPTIVAQAPGDGYTLGVGVAAGATTPNQPVES